MRRTVLCVGNAPPQPGEPEPSAYVAGEVTGLVRPSGSRAAFRRALLEGDAERARRIAGRETAAEQLERVALSTARVA